MSQKVKVQTYPTLPKLAIRLRDDLNDADFVLLYAFNGTGKTRLSTEFANRGKKGEQRDTLYFNAFTEDLFSWDNDLENNAERRLLLNKKSRFFEGLEALELDTRIRPRLQRYASFDFTIKFDEGFVSFKRDVRVRNKTQGVDFIKVSRGEENIFIWCFFLAIAQLAIDAEGESPYSWVKYLYIDDPISSLDDNNAIAVAGDLSQLLRKANGRIKTVVSSHHALFFNVLCNELKKRTHTKYFLHRQTLGSYSLQKTDDTPFFHHVAILSELQQVAASGLIQTYHFNVLRSVLEKTATFFGYPDFSDCLHGIKDEELHARALNLFSHGNQYSVFAPREMVDDNKELFRSILEAFLAKYQFALPTL
jgi:hypothetical protein